MIVIHIDNLQRYHLKHFRDTTSPYVRKPDNQIKQRPYNQLSLYSAGTKLSKGSR